MMILSDATISQMRAADPTATVWVTANAGSGKTKVLIDRVARLLLRGVEPQRILCLTYTKAAATEMQNRLFERLGGWAMKPDADLRVDLAGLGEDQSKATDSELLTARRLFARALEAPGGLRIQTIHSFCASLLRRFPIEARVSPGFKEMDDRASKLLKSQIVEDMSAKKAPSLMAEVAKAFASDSFDEFVQEIVTARHDFKKPFDWAAACAVFGVDPLLDTQGIIDHAMPPDLAELSKQVAELLAKSPNKTDKAVSIALSAIDFQTPGTASFRALKPIFLTAKDALRKSPITGPGIALLGPLADRMKTLALTVLSTNEALNSLAAARKSLVLYRFANTFLPLYEDAKARNGWLDFDDLIASAVQLLSDNRMAAWVLYRLDGGIDHILVDEAQDTSPSQWKVIELLAAEFTAGQSARNNRDRTLFVVGDKKQSIYSFQGADVAAFDEKQSLFKRRFSEAGLPFLAETLKYSFRSSPAVLQLVDSTFSSNVAEALGEYPGHIAHHGNVPGRVDLWPLIEKSETTSDTAFENTDALVSEEMHETLLAKQVAGNIRTLIDQGTHIPDKDKGSRAVHAGDFLILVQRRGQIFHEIIRACKAEGLPIAGADRLKLGSELAVRDITALLEFLALPEDDLALATLLRSPLCGWSEDELYRLAHGREGFLWRQLRHSSANSDAFLMLNDLLGKADFLRPYDLIERALTLHQGRQRLIARLGEEAEEGIDELLSQALVYERGDVPSLTGFLIWLAGDSIDVKRQMESAGRRIRVMTVHGSKGLEAPIVILPDTADRKAGKQPEVLITPERIPVWKASSGQSPPLLTSINEQRAQKSQDEKTRLLYVALTRAKYWLIVAAAGTAKDDGGDDAESSVTGLSWYRQVQLGMERLGPVTMPNGVLRWASGDWPVSSPAATMPDARVASLPEWAVNAAAPEERPSQPISPSKFGGSKSLPGEVTRQSEEAILARGTAVHALLEHLPNLPPADWQKAAQRLIFDPALCAEALEEASRLINKPELAWLFGLGSLAEVSFAAPYKGRVLSGSIDRLIVRDYRVCVVDFKSNLVIPNSPGEVPEGILQQLGAYQYAVHQIMPGYTVEPYVLWTRTGQITALDSKTISLVFESAAIP
jgi:ATP-dependent helicase/nuclease subunit A